MRELAHCYGSNVNRHRPHTRGRENCGQTCSRRRLTMIRFGVAGALYLGAAWSAVHSGGRDDVILLGFGLLAVVTPVALAFGAHWLTRRALLLARAQIHNPEVPNDFRLGS